jgi:uncharacterized protein with beta-barrel porin domain
MGALASPNAQFLNGQLDEVAVHDRALSATEIAAIYSETSPIVVSNVGKVTSPVTVSSGATLSGNGRTGGITNSGTIAPGNLIGGIKMRNLQQEHFKSRLADLPTSTRMMS